MIFPEIITDYDMRMHIKDEWDFNIIYVLHRVPYIANISMNTADARSNRTLMICKIIQKNWTEIELIYDCQSIQP